MHPEQPVVCVCVCVFSVPAVVRGWCFSPRGLDKRSQSGASPWQQVSGYNLSVKLNGARVTRPRAGVPPVSPITSAGPVADTYSVFIMWKKNRLCSSTWLPPNNRAHLSSCTSWQQHHRGVIFNAIMVVWWRWSSKVAIIRVRKGLWFSCKRGKKPADETK